MKAKFEVGQKVKVKQDGEVGAIVAFSYSSESGFRYSVSSKEVDIEKKEVIHGVKNCLEDELEAVKEAKE